MSEHKTGHLLTKTENKGINSAMELKTQIILVATLFIVFAVLSAVARTRNRSRKSSLHARKRRRRMKQSDEDFADMEADVPDIIGEESKTAKRSNTPIILAALAIAVACAAAVAVLIW